MDFVNMDEHGNGLWSFCGENGVVHGLGNGGGGLGRGLGGVGRDLWWRWRGRKEVGVVEELGRGVVVMWWRCMAMGGEDGGGVRP